MSRACNLLMVYPRFKANTFWNFSEACKLLNARYPTAPLGLITVAAMLPANWNVRLINRNTEEVTAEDLAWADMVMTGGMMISNSIRCGHRVAHKHGKPVVVGGPDATSSPAPMKKRISGCSVRSRRYYRAVCRGLGMRASAAAPLWPRNSPSTSPKRRCRASICSSPHTTCISACNIRGVSVHLRVLRYHRALRPRAAHQDAAADAGRTSGALRSRLSRPCRFRRR